MEQEYIGILETNDGVLTIVKEGNFLIAGGVCNVGLLESDRIKIDEYFSLDENVSSFVEELEEKYGVFDHE